MFISGVTTPEEKTNDWQLLPPGNADSLIVPNLKFNDSDLNLFHTLCSFFADIPIEIFIIITVGIVIIIAVIIITIVIKCTCNNNNRTPQESYPHFDANSIPPNYGYTSSKAHQGSSWACTFKGGQQMNTHIWETPVPEPHDGEYTLPASMKKQLGIRDKQNQLGSESGTGGASHFHPKVPLTVNPPQNQLETNIQGQYTMPVKLLQDRKEGDTMTTTVECEYTMPVKMKEQTNTVTASTSSDYTIPVLPQPVPDTPDSESEYTVPTGMGVSDQKHNKGDGRASFQRIL